MRRMVGAVIAVAMALSTACGSDEPTAEPVAPATTERAASAPPSEPPPARFSETDPEYLMARIDLGVQDTSEIRIERYEIAIDRLQLYACQSESRMQIADYAVGTRELLSENAGVEVTAMEVLQGVTTAASSEVPVDCVSLFSTWGVLRERLG